MFTGLIEATGRIDRIERHDDAARLRLATPLAGELRPGDSIAVNGVCLTVTQQEATGFSADVSPETLRVTSLGSLTPGRLVNLERPVRADARMGGHFVLGHVDATGRVLAFDREGDCYRLRVELPARLAPLLVEKGSIAVDGISLTVAALGATEFAMQIVPFTRAHTALSELASGELVNIEADVLGKHVARLLQTSQVSTPTPEPASSLT
jgi:riboflavin synthase